MRRVVDHDAIWGVRHSGWNIENEAFSITKKTPKFLIPVEWVMTHCIPRCSIEIASFQGPSCVYIVHALLLRSKTSDISGDYSFFRLQVSFAGHPLTSLLPLFL